MEGRKTNCHRDTYKGQGVEERGRIVIKLSYEWLVSFMLRSFYMFFVLSSLVLLVLPEINSFRVVKWRSVYG